MYDEIVKDFSPLRIFTKWSKVMSATYMVLVDFRNCKESKNVREKIVEKINSYWIDCGKQGLLISSSPTSGITGEQNEL